MTDNAAQFVGSIPGHYDQGLGPRIFFDYADDLACRTARYSPDTVLELAAGTGIVTRRLRDQLADECHILASDLNLPMLDVARQKFEPHELVEFEQVDATELRFGDASFDVVLCQFGVMFFPDKSRSYAEVHRVLNNGGSYIFNVWDSWTANPFAEITHEAVATFFPDDPPGFYKVPFSYHDAEAIRDALTLAGFSSVRVEQLPQQSAIPSAHQFARGLVFGNPLYDEIIDRGGDPNDVAIAVEAAIKRELGDSLLLNALVFEATKE